MFTIKFIRQPEGEPIQCVDVVSVNQYSKVPHDGRATGIPKMEIILRDSAFQGLEHIRTIEPLAELPEDRKPFRYDYCYVENAEGKTIDHIRADALQ